MKPLVIATRNEGKLREIKALLAGVPCEVKSLLDFPRAPKVEESGLTYEENALLKAEAMVRALQLPVLADDSGIELDALSGEPGVFSARWSGEGCGDEDNNRKLMETLADVPLLKRGAKYVCVMVFATPGAKPTVVRADCRGFIPFEPLGDGGFGYDPHFALSELGKTMAQLTLEEKNKISHRARAIQKLLPLLKSTYLSFLVK